MYMEEGWEEKREHDEKERGVSRHLRAKKQGGRRERRKVGRKRRMKGIRSIFIYISGLYSIEGG